MPKVFRIGRIVVSRALSGRGSFGQRLMLASALFLLFALAPSIAGAATPHAGGVSLNTCSACHTPHSATTSRYIFRDRGGPAGQETTCFYCHDGTGASGNVKTGPDSFAGTSGHVLEGITDGTTPTDLTNTCSGCHVPHGDPSIRPKLPAATVNGVAISAAGNDWCLACHNDQQDWYEQLGTYPALSSPSRDATGYPVAGTFGGSTVYENAAVNAHANIPASIEPTRTEGDCLYCHNAHGSTSDYDALSANFRPSTVATVANDRATGAYAEVCFQCHGGGTWETQGAANIKQYVTHEATDTSLMASGGHRIKTAGGNLPVNAPLPCYDCHNPHGSSRGNARLLSDELGGSLDTSAGPEAVRQFCLTCHVTSDLFGWDSVGSAYAAVSADADVEGLLRNGGTFGLGPDGGFNWLRLKVTGGHQRADTSMSCYDCHGSEYGTAESKNVHDPGSYSVPLHTGTPTSENITINGVSYGPYACSTCHNVELGPEHDKATSSSSETDCGTCHPTPRSSLTPAWDRNTCAQGDCHTVGSTAPMHAEVDSDHTAGATCTPSGCHSTSAAAIHSAPGGPGCTACHAEGVTPTLACRACHTDPHPAENHGGTADSCGSCHATNEVTAIHADDCARCHPNPAQSVTYTGGCQQAGCHPTPHLEMANYPPWQHTNLPSWHGPSEDNCWECHPGDGGACDSCHTWDRTPPVTTSNARASYKSAAAIALTATDPATGSATGVAFTYYQVDGGTTQTGNTVIVPGPSAGSEEHTLEFWSIDNAFNTEAHHIVYFTVRAGIDSSPPTGTMFVNNDAPYANSYSVLANSAVTDADSGIAAVRVDPGTGVFGAWTDYRAVLPVTLTDGNGLKTVQVEYRDVSNNTLLLSDTITVDTVVPVGSLRINNNAVATNSTTVTLDSSVTDALSGVTHMFFSNSNNAVPTWEPYSPTKTWTIAGGTNGIRRVYAQYRDAAGNILYTSDTINYDNIPPTGTMTVNNDAVFTAMTSVTVNSAVTDAYSGLDQMRIDPGTGTFGSWIAYSASYPITLPDGDGLKTVRAEYRDRAGNVLALTDTISLTTIDDPTPPTGSVVINGGAAWTNSTAVVLTLDATDTGGSGLYQMRFSNDNLTWSAWETYATSRNWSISTGTNPRTVYAQFRDGVGNISISYNDTISRETVAPTGTIVINGGAAWTNDANVTLTLTASDSGGSGLAGMSFSNDGTTFSAWEPFAATKNWALSSGAAVKTVHVRYRDNAGNTFQSFDTIAYLLEFTLTYTAGPGGTITGATPQTVQYSGSGTAVTATPDAGYHFLGWSDGIATASRTDTNIIENKAVTAWFAADGTHTLRFLTDGAGYVEGQWIQGVTNGGSTTAVTAYPHEPTYYFSYWSNGTSYNSSQTLVLNDVTSSQTWTAYFTYSGSCPFLYTWDGNSYVFEADEFAAGYLGLRTSKGYRRPNPLDYHITATTPEPKDGALEYKLVEERDETDYLDQVKLYTVDAPADREVYVERSQAEGVGQFTTLEAVIHTTARDLEPPPSVKWINTGREVRDLLAASDGDRVVLNDDRNAGYTYQTLELDLGDVQDAPQVKLVIDGRTMIPTSQAGRTYSRTFGPQVKFEVQNADGAWVAVPSTTAILPKPPEFDRPFVLDLSNIWLSDSRKVRLTYLYKTYLDSILLDTTADVPVTLTELPLVSADLQPHGFNFREGIGEWYDYVYGLPFAEPRYKLPGNYTRFGDVTQLLTGDVDDKFVIFGGGDELTLRFAPPEDDPADVTRRYLFLSNGYYKTLKEDIPHTVEPLPFAAMSNFPYPDTEQYPTDTDHQQYLLEWNTRREGDR